MTTQANTEMDDAKNKAEENKAFTGGAGTGAGHGLRYTAKGWRGDEGAAPRRPAYNATPDMSAPEYRDLGHRIGGDITGGGSGAGARNSITELRPEPAAAKAAGVLADAGLCKRGTLPHSPKRAKASTPKPLVIPDAARADFSQPVFESGKEAARWAWEQAHGDLVAEVSAEHDLGRRLLRIGQRAAARAGRRLLAQKGVTASDTSLADAASEAVLSVLLHVRGLDRLTAEQWTRARVLRVVCLYAARGAQKSLVGWARVGMTGDNSQAVAWLDWSSMAAEALHEAADKGTTPGSADKSARLAAVRWVFRVGFLQFRDGLPGDMRPAARAAAARAARSRCRVVSNVLLGSSLADACALSGFGSVKAFANSCDAAGFWESLQAAAASRLGQHEEQARVALRRYGLEVGQLRRALLALGDVRPVITQTHHVTSKGWPAKLKTTDKAKLAKWQAACSLWEQYLTAKARAVHYRGAVQAARAADAKAWARIAHGIKSSRCADLRQLVGLVDAKGKRRKAS